MGTSSPLASSFPDELGTGDKLMRMTLTTRQIGELLVWVSVRLSDLGNFMARIA